MSHPPGPSEPLHIHVDLPREHPDGGRGGAVATVVRVGGEIDLATVPALQERLHTLIAGGHHALVLDLTQVTFCDVPGLNALLRAETHARSHGGRLQIRGPCPPLDIMLTALDLHDRLYGPDGQGGVTN